MPRELPRPVRFALGVTGPGVDDGRLRAAVAGQVVLVTGASSGIGAATARRLSGAEATVLLVARRVELLEDLQRELKALGGQAHVHPCDLSHPDEVDDLAARVLEEHGHVDVLVNNAGRSIRRWISQSYDRPHDVERTAAVNFLGPARLTLALLRSMRARGAGQIVSVGSAGSYFGAPRWTAYVASKTAFDTWLRGVAPEAAIDGVATSTLYLPLVRTPMVGSSTALRRSPAMTAEEAAGMVCRAIVTRRRTVAPWWWRPATGLALLLETPVHRLTTAYVRRTHRE